MPEHFGTPGFGLPRFLLFPVMAESLRAKVLSGLFWASIQNWAVKLLTLVLFAALARLLEPEEFGLFAAASAVLALVEIFSEQGLSEAIIQRKDINAGQLNSAFLLNISMAVVLTLGLWFLAPFIATVVMKAPQIADLLRGASLVLLINALGFTQTAMYSRSFEYRKLAGISVAATTLSGALALSAAYRGLGAWSLVIQLISAAAINSLLLWREPKWKISAIFDTKGLRELIQYSMFRLANRLTDYANTRYIEIFLGSILGSAALGLYMIGSRLYQALLQILGSAVLGVAHNAFSRMAHDSDALRRAYYQAMRVSAALAVPTFIMLSALAQEVTELFFGSRWGDAAKITELMALLGALQVLQFYNGTSFNAIGKPNLTLNISLLKTGITLATLWFSRHEDLYNIVCNFVLAHALGAIPSFWAAIRVLRISVAEVILNIWPFLASSGLAWWAIYATRQHVVEPHHATWWSILLLAATGSAVYVVSALLLGRRMLASMWAALRLQKASA